jgi:hypothetical protein
MKIKILVLFKIFSTVHFRILFQPLMSLLMLPPWSCYSSLKRFNKKWYFICTIYSITLFFTNHSFFDLENACGIYDEDMEKSLMPILLL